MVTFVETDYTEPDIRYTLVGTAGGNDPDTGDIYRGLDRFGRIVDSYWYDYGASADVDRIKYGYDRSGNRLWRENVVARSLGKYFDEKYLYDEIHRLKDMERGELTSGQSSITNLQFAQCWGLDETGNWSNFREDDDGDGSWNLNQNRTANKVNEISDITECTGPSWATPAYSPAGNMTTVPKSADPTTSFTATYDAWNRLTKLVDTTSSDTVAEYEYDGARRRTIQKSYTGGTLDETRHLYYTEPSQWQVIEERVDSDTAPNRQFIWGLRYIDDLILRDRDTTGNGTLNERLYALQDANWNCTAIVDTEGAVQQRLSYTAYGITLFLTSGFVSGINSVDWDTLFSGYRLDSHVALYFVRHRVFNETLGRWCSRDPMGLSTGINVYVYAGSTPLSFLDPSGLIVITITVIGAIKAIGAIVVIAGVIYTVTSVGGCVMTLMEIGGNKKLCDQSPTWPKVQNALSHISSCLGSSSSLENAVTSGRIKCDDVTEGGMNTTFLAGLAVVPTECTTHSAGDVAMSLLGEFWRLAGNRGANGNTIDSAAHDAEMATLHTCLCNQPPTGDTMTNPHTTRTVQHQGLDGAPQGSVFPPCP